MSCAAFWDQCLKCIIRFEPWDPPCSLLLPLILNMLHNLLSESRTRCTHTERRHVHTNLEWLKINKLWNQIMAVDCKSTRYLSILSPANRLDGLLVCEPGWCCRAKQSDEGIFLLCHSIILRETLLWFALNPACSNHKVIKLLMSVFPSLSVN